MRFAPLVVTERLGHEKIQITLNTYSYLYPSKQGELADKLEIEDSMEEEAVGAVIIVWRGACYAIYFCGKWGIEVV